MADYQSNKVLIFSGINDIPVAPSSTSGGNISHLYSLYNSLIDLLQTDIDTLQNTTVVDYSTDITNLQSSVSTLQTDVSNISANVTTNNSSIIANTNNINSNTTAIATANTNINNLSNSINTNTNDISTNSSNIGTLTTDISSLQTSIGSNQTSINTLTTDITNLQTDVATLNSSSGLITESFANNINFFLDTVNGSDTNDGLSSSTPFLTLDKLISVLITKHLPQNTTISIKGTINQTIDLSGISTLINRKGKLNRAKVTFNSFDTGNFTINHSGTLIKTNNNFPLFIVFTQCDFFGNTNSLDIINSNSFYDFVPPCNFDTNAGNTESILYFENTDVELSTFGSDLVFNNSNTASLECGIKLVKTSGVFEKCTVNDISTFIIADDRSFVRNVLNSTVDTNVNIIYDLRNHSEIRTDRYTLLNSPPKLIIDNTSNINNAIHYTFNFSNPPLNTFLTLINNAQKDYFVRNTGIGGLISGVNYDLYSNTDLLPSTNYIVEQDKDLRIVFTSYTTLDYMALNIVLYEDE